MTHRPSVLTIVRGRETHLRNVVAGLARSSLTPAELVICVMGGPAPAILEEAGLPFPIVWTRLDPAGRTPLAAARNAAARAASGERLVFLDVDCIPSRGALGAYEEGAERAERAILMGGVRYLQPGPVASPDDDAHLIAHSLPHPARPLPLEPGLTPEPQVELFWSLSFALSRATFELVGGFDEGFEGYGAEDTDFAFRACEAGVELAWIGGADVFHQHHESFDPPLAHLHDIVANARRFRQCWGLWPMPGWLEAFARLGLIRWNPDEDEIEMVRDPS